MNRLKELRKEKKLTQKELANLMGVNVKTIGRWERGEFEIKLAQAKMLADFLGVTPGYLLGYSDFPARNIRELLTHEVKALKEYEVVRVGGRNFISENQVLNIIDKYVP